MGGVGSGGWYRWRTKGIVEDCLMLDVNKLVRDGLIVRQHTSGMLHWRNTRTGEQTASAGYRLEPFGDDGLVFRLLYTVTVGGEKQEADEPIILQTTRPHFGGIRWWFTCPLVMNGHPCNRRVGKLYAPPSGIYFGCRHCYDLAYDSQRQKKHKRLLYKAQRIRMDLGGDPSCLAPFPDKPKHMHRSTYWRLRAEAEEADFESLLLADAEFAKQMASVAKLLRNRGTG